MEFLMNLIMWAVIGVISARPSGPSGPSGPSESSGSSGTSPGEFDIWHGGSNIGNRIPGTNTYR